MPGCHFGSIRPTTTCEIQTTCDATSSKPPQARAEQHLVAGTGTCLQRWTVSTLQYRQPRQGLHPLPRCTGQAERPGPGAPLPHWPSSPS